MRTSRSRTLYHLSLAGLAFLALRPVAPLVRALDLLLAPSAVLSHLCAPLAWMGGRPAMAGEGQAEADHEAQLALEQAVLASAEPRDPSCVERLAGVRALRAEVSGRPRDDRDRIWLRLAQPDAISSLRTGDAVVSGDAFIGIVDVETSRLAAQVGVVEVQLVTGAQFRLGAEVDPADSRFTGPIVGRRRMVVGGLAPHPDRVLLAVHNPEQPGGVGARVIVREAVRDGVRTHLANGFVLGVLERGIPAAWEYASARLAEESVLGIKPIMDFAHGLHQVLILTDTESETSVDAASDLVLPVQDTAAWRSTRLLLRGEVSPLRAGRKISSGRVTGVSVGAAVSAGTHLLGRVIRVGPLGADLSLIADPGLRISTIALVQDGSSKFPHVLGQLTSLGPGSAGTVRFHWPATLPLVAPSGVDSGTGLPVQIWTGSGDAGLPRGLLIGEARLPFGPGPHVLEVLLATDGHLGYGARVWVGAPPDLLKQGAAPPEEEM
ncbi:MAG TPA: hypothetical protein EYQ74_11760 [Planctomycetes bacterium]|nr:hypothetical protein [Planctomycetota bacterium]HIK61892.1 hypothetical protein [Planctomycetota bacterium]